MKSSVIIFPGSNCDRDAAVALQAATGSPAQMVWHGDSTVPDSDIIVLPGGFSFGDYLRCGAMAAHSPIMRDVVAKAKAGVPILGICNGFQMLTETGLLPGILMRNASLNFICRDLHLKVENTDTPFTAQFSQGQIVRIPVAHHDGNFFADQETLTRLEGDGRVAFRYCDEAGTVSAAANPNGSCNSIAGIADDSGKILGLMPHPERLNDVALGGSDGAIIFRSIAQALAA